MLQPLVLWFCHQAGASGETSAYQKYPGRRL